MKNCNLVVVSGVIDKDLDMKEGTYGPFGTMSIVITEPKLNKDKKIEDVKCRIAVALTGSLAKKAVGMNLARGNEVFVRGKLKLEIWDKKDGTKGFMHKIVAEDLYDVSGRLDFEDEE
jgi:single-stranded DNA-binding protein